MITDYQKKIFNQMKKADSDLKNAKEIFPESLFFNIEPPHQIFAKAFNIDDFKMAEKIVNLMYSNSELNENNYNDLIQKMNDVDGQIDLYFDCFHEGEIIPMKYIKHLIKLWIKRNGVITFDSIARKSYVENFIKSSKLSPDSKINRDAFKNLLNEPPFNKLQEVFKKNVEIIKSQSSCK